MIDNLKWLVAINGESLQIISMAYYWSSLHKKKLVYYFKKKLNKK